VRIEPLAPMEEAVEMVKRHGLELARDMASLSACTAFGSKAQAHWKAVYDWIELIEFSHNPAETQGEGGE